MNASDIRIDSIPIRTLSTGDDSSEVPPDPIPNSEVKLQGADGTAGVTLWESRSRRSPFSTPDRNCDPGSFCFWSRRSELRGRRPRRPVRLAFGRVGSMIPARCQRHRPFDGVSGPARRVAHRLPRRATIVNHRRPTARSPGGRALSVAVPSAVDFDRWGRAETPVSPGSRTALQVGVR